SGVREIRCNRIRALSLPAVVEERVGDGLAANAGKPVGKHAGPEEREVAHVLVNVAAMLGVGGSRRTGRLREHFGNLFEAASAGVAEGIDAIDVGKLKEQVGEVVENFGTREAQLGVETVFDQSAEKTSQRMTLANALLHRVASSTGPSPAHR